MLDPFAAQLLSTGIQTLLPAAAAGPATIGLTAASILWSLYDYNQKQELQRSEIEKAAQSKRDALAFQIAELEAAKKRNYLSSTFYSRQAQVQKNELVYTLAKNGVDIYRGQGSQMVQNMERARNENMYTIIMGGA